MSAITTWPAVDRPRDGRIVQASHAELAAQIRRRASLPRIGELWSPAECRDGRRCDEHVERVSWLALDYDEGDVDPRRVWRGVSGIVYTTGHHERPKGEGCDCGRCAGRPNKPAVPRYRAIIELSRTVSADEYRLLVRRVMATRTGTIDPISAIPSQSYYWPSRPADVWVIEGSALDVEGELAQGNLPLSTTAAKPSAPTSPQPVDADMPPRVSKLLGRSDWLRERWAGDGRRKDGTEYQSRSERDFAIARYLLGNGVSVDSTAGAMQLRGPDERTDERYVRRTVERAAAAAGDDDDAPPPEDRPTIRMGVDLHRVVDEAVAALAQDGELYQRDGQLVHVVRAADLDALASAGTPQIRTVPTAQLRERLTRVTDWERYDGRSEDWRPCTPSDAVTGAVAARGEWPPVRPLVGVLEAPSMRPDGSVIQSPGYDAVTGWLYQPGDRYLSVPDAPTQAKACDALRELCEVWSEFAWVNDAAMYVPIAATLTMLARPAIQGPVPATGIDASTAGSGKGLAAQATAVIATGREAATLTWPAAPEEAEKVLGSLAIRGARVALFDNVSGTFGGDALDKALTTGDRIALRVLGRSEVPELSWRTVVVATGNGLMLGGDTSRRMLLARQEPGCERPEERTGWRHDPLLAWVRDQRSRLVVAALTVLRGYVAAGRPYVGLRPWGSFETWSRLIPSAIVWAGGADVMTCRAKAAGADDEAARLTALLEGWAHLVPEGGTVRTVIDSLYPRERLRGEQLPPDGYDGMREAIERMAPPRPGQAPQSHRVGNALRRIRGRVVGGRRLVQVASHGHSQVWRAELCS